MRTSRQLFCPFCGEPAVLQPAPKGGNPNWKAQWINGCAHATGGPQRMGPRRAAKLAESYAAARAAAHKAAQQAIASCDGEPT